MTRFGKSAGAAAGAPQKGRFAGVAPGGSRFPQLPYGNHVIEILETRRATVKGDTFIADVQIVQSGDAPVGTKHGYVQSMKDSFNVGAGKVLAFVLAAGNCDDAETEKVLSEAEQGISIVDAACGVATEYGENPLKGLKVRVYASQGQPDGKGGHYTDCAFSPFTE